MIDVETSAGMIESRPAQTALLATLDIAVPLWIARLRETSEEQRSALAHDCAQIVAEYGDVLQFGGRRGQAAEVCDALARALALLSYRPDGVDFAGRHWEASSDTLARLLGGPQHGRHAITGEGSRS